MPNNYKDWDAWSIRQFISGLFTADGHIGIHKCPKNPAAISYKFNLASTSLPLLEQVN
jgi:hypothetical protein